MFCEIGEELHTLTNEEVEPAVGSYDFRDIPDMIDRFIIWLVPSIFFFTMLQLLFLVIIPVRPIWVAILGGKDYGMIYIYS